MRYLPGQDCQRVQTFAVVRFKNRDGGDLMWRYAWVVGGGAVQKSRLHEPEAAREVFAAHCLKGAKEQGFHQLLGGMDLHHPPCLSSLADAVNAAIRPFLFSPRGLRVFLARPALLARDETAAGITTVPTPWPGQKFSSNTDYSHYFTASQGSPQEIGKKATPPKESKGGRRSFARAAKRCRNRVTSLDKNPTEINGSIPESRPSGHVLPPRSRHEAPPTTPIPPPEGIVRIGVK
ncbi:MAG: hypothetical protein Fur0032_03080 [Terrimicrobiaceae bacterium]